MKGVSEIISYVLIVLLVFSLISFILLWGLPYLQKRQDEMKLNLIFNDLFSENSPNSIINKMKDCFLRKTTEKVGGYDGIWNISDKYVTFSFISRASPVSSNEWITIYGCVKDICEFFEGFYEVQASSEKIENYYIVKYRVILKKLNINNNIYDIRFERNFYSQTKYIYLSSNIDEVNKIIYFSVR